MPTPQTDSKTRSATLVGSHRITAETATEEVRHLVFRTGDSTFPAVVGACIRILAPGQFGAKHHARLYSILDVVPNKDDATEFAICVRRCQYVDQFNGERYDGVASNHLCNLRAGDAVSFIGPVSYPFAVPDDKNTNLLMIGMGTGIAPFRGLVRQIYEKVGGWQGKVRLFFGAKSGLELLYMNNENSDLALYYDQPTFKGYNLVQCLVYALGAGGGFTLALVIMSGLREQLALHDVPNLARGAGLTLMVAGILSLAFMGFAGLGG